MKFHEIKSHVRDTLSTILVVVIGISFYFCLQNLKSIMDGVNYILAVLSPITYGVIIAYVLSPICNKLEKRLRKDLLKQMKDPKKAVKVSNGLSTFISFSIFILFLFLIFSLIIPQLIFTVSTMIETLPDNIQRMSDMFQNMFNNNNFIKSKVGILWSDMISYLEEFLQKNVLPNLNLIISGVSMGVTQIIREVSNFIIGLVVSIYCLNSRKTFARQGKKILFACFNENHAQFLISKLRFIDHAFSNFVSGKLLEALAVSIICFIGMSFIGSQYTLLVSVIIGVTNLIPFFGPVIGGIPSAFILLFEDPIKCLYFIIFLIVLVQIDSNILGPKILGKSTGLTGFWIVFSIIFFGGIFGIIGMIIGIPLFSVIYKMGSDCINYMLNKRKQQNENVH